MERVSDFESNLSEFLEMTFRLTEEELQAVDHMIPMTQELFDSIVDKCTDMNADNFFFKFIEEFPEFLEVYAERVEQEVGEEKV